EIGELGGGPISIPVFSDVADAKVRLQISQSATLTRSAFAGLLDISNHSGSPLQNVHVDLTFTDANGNDATSAFFVAAPELTGFSGDGQIDVASGQGPEIAGGNGSVHWVFIPTVGAAPNVPTVYNIGGSFSYDDSEGHHITMPMFPATITVFPDAHFVLN